jgi:hypothetical protein
VEYSTLFMIIQQARQHSASRSDLPAIHIKPSESALLPGLGFKPAFSAIAVSLVR